MSDPRTLLKVEVIAEWLEREGFHIRDMGLLAAALERPWLRFDGTELYPDPWHKAAALLHSIQSSHPLYDGNKRAGVLLTSLLLAAHGVDDAAISDDEFFDLVCDIAATHPSVEFIARKLERLTS